MATLYRTYRPTQFDEVVGQDQVVAPLQRALQRNTIAHAYVFHGPRGTGKTTTARILAKALNCTKLDSETMRTCGLCGSCEAQESANNLDLVEIDAASNRGIDDIRALQNGIAQRPVYGSYKVFIIDEVHMLSHDAFAALLKTLEEPPSHAIFILATTEFHKVPETILSRCQVYRFRRAAPEEMRGLLKDILQKENREISAEALDFIIMRSDGCYRDAESLLGQVLTLESENISRDDVVRLLGLPPRESVESFVLSLVRGESAPALDVADTIYADGFDPEQLLLEAIRLARDWAVAAGMGEGTPVGEHASQLPTVIRSLIQAVQDLAYVPEPLIAIEVAIVSVCTVKATPSVSTPQSSPAAKPAPLTKESQIPKDNALDLEKISAAWPQLVENIKKSNPVAGTFVRAMKPIQADDSGVVIEAQYALHKNFFEKPANRELVAATLGELVGSGISISLELNKPVGANGSLSEKRSQAEEDLVKAAEEVFG